MSSFIIDPSGNRHNTQNEMHVDYFVKNFIDDLSDRQILRFLKTLNIQPQMDNLHGQLKSLCLKLATQGDFQDFYCGASDTGFLCGLIVGYDMILRMTDFDCVRDSHISEILNIIQKNNIAEIDVDFVSPYSPTVRSEEYTEKEFLAHL